MADRKTSAAALAVFLINSHTLGGNIRAIIVRHAAIQIADNIVNVAAAPEAEHNRVNTVKPKDIVQRFPIVCRQVSAAKGLAFSVDKPAVGVSTLAAMARNVAFFDGLIVCAMDARRSQVYNANFSAENGVLTRLTPDRAVSLDELAEEIRNDPRPITLVGDGAHLAYARFTEQGIPCRMASHHFIL